MIQVSWFWLVLAADMKIPPYRLGLNCTQDHYMKSQNAIKYITNFWVLSYKISPWTNSVECIKILDPLIIRIVWNKKQGHDSRIQNIHTVSSNHGQYELHNSCPHQYLSLFIVFINKLFKIGLENQKYRKKYKFSLKK